MKDIDRPRIHVDRQTEADPRAYALALLEDPIQLAHLLNDRRNRLLRRNIKREFGKGSPDQLLELTGKLLDAIGSPDEKRTTDKKDGAVHLLREVSLERVDPQKLFDLYREELDKQKKPIDPTGNIFPLVEAGNILTPHFPSTDETIHDLAAALDSTAKKLQDGHDDHHGIRARMAGLLNHLHLRKITCGK